MLALLYRSKQLYDAELILFLQRVLTSENLLDTSSRRNLTLPAGQYSRHIQLSADRNNNVLSAGSSTETRCGLYFL